MAPMTFLEKGNRFRRYDLAFRVYVRYSAAFDRDRPAAYEPLLSELCNTQSCFRFFKDSVTSYDSNFLEDAGQALYRLESLLGELDSESLDPISLEEADLIRYRKHISVLTHLSFAYILMQVIYNPGNDSQTSLVRLESFLVDFYEQWHNPIPIIDLQSWLESPDAKGEQRVRGVPEDAQGERRVRAVPEPAQAPVQDEIGAQIVELPGDLPGALNAAGILFVVPRDCKSRDPLFYKIPLQRVKLRGTTPIDLTFLRDDGNDAMIELCQRLLAGIIERLSRAKILPSIAPRTSTHPLYRVIQYFGATGKRIIAFNFPRKPMIHPTDLNQFVHWNTERWLCLVLWWITKAQYRNPTQDLPALLEAQPGMGAWLDPASQHSNFQLCKAILILHTVLGGRSLTHLLDHESFKLIQELRTSVQTVASQRSAQFTGFITGANAGVIGGAQPRQNGMHGSHADRYPYGTFSIIDVRQIGESGSGNDSTLDPLKIVFTKMCTVELNVEPRQARMHADETTLAVIQVGYSEYSPRTPHFRLISPLAEVIVSEPFPEWKILKPMGQSRDGPLTYYTELRIQSRYVNFALITAESRTDFETKCHDIQSGICLPNSKRRSWLINKAIHGQGTFESAPYTCYDGKITIEDHILPGSKGGSRQRHIILEPESSWGLQPHKVSHIPLNNLKVIAEESNGRIQIEWNLPRIEKTEFMYQPKLFDQVHHYHRDTFSRLFPDKDHEQTVPEVEMGFAAVASDHLRYHALCKEEDLTGSVNEAGNQEARGLIYFSHDKVIVGGSAGSQASWTCPFSQKQENSDLYGYHSLDIRLSRPKAVTEFCDYILQVDPDTLTLEEKVNTFKSASGKHDIIIFKSELFPSNHRIVELHRRNKYTNEVQVSFVTEHANIQLKTAANRSEYTIVNLLSHPFGSRCFDGDVGQQWSQATKAFSTAESQPLYEIGLLGVLRPHWQQVFPKRSGLGSFRQLRLSQQGAKTSEPPVFKCGEGEIRFYKDTSLLKNNLYCWVNGEDGNSFVYWKVREFCRGMKAGIRGLLLNNWLVMDVSYEHNMITEPSKHGTVRLEFGQGSSIFEEFIVNAKHGDGADGSIYTKGTLSSGSSIVELPPIFFPISFEKVLRLKKIPLTLEKLGSVGAGRNWQLEILSGFKLSLALPYERILFNHLGFPVAKQ